MDCAGFTTIEKHGGYPKPTSDFAREVNRWRGNGNLVAAVSRDYMCEAPMLARTGMTVEQHQRLTIREYDDLITEKTDTYILPVLQGYEPLDYARHVQMYGERFPIGAWVGVGSVCKRNADIGAILAVLSSVKTLRPDLRLHGFGLKSTALANGTIRHLLHSADSMAWSYAARKQRRNGNDYREAIRFTQAIEKSQRERAGSGTS